MHDLRQRLARVEAQQIAALLTALETSCARFAAHYGRDAYVEPFLEVLAPFAESQIEMFGAALLAAKEKGSGASLRIPDLEALVRAFQDHMEGVSP
jgi:hypothetical protein